MSWPGTEAASWKAHRTWCKRGQKERSSWRVGRGGVKRCEATVGRGGVKRCEAMPSLCHIYGLVAAVGVYEDLDKISKQF